MKHLLVSAALLSACSFNTATPNVDTILCTATVDCPNGMVCRASIGQCVSGSVVNDPPPALAGTPGLTPTLARSGTLLTLTFEADRPVSATLRPLVVLRTFSGQRQGSFTPLSASGQSFEYTYAVTGLEREGAAEVVVVLTGATGAVSGDLRAGEVELDFTAPSVIPGSQTLQLLPGPQNPRARVEEVTYGTEARLSFATTEPLRELPTLQGTPQAIAWAAPQANSSLSAFTFVGGLPDAGTPQGAVALSAQLVDRAGNTAAAPLQVALVVDTDPPPPPDTATPDRVVLQRVPYGAELSGGRPAFSVHLQPGAHQGASVSVRAIDLGIELKQQDVDGGLNVVELPLIDAPEVELAALDRAGNRSAYAKVRDVVYLATLGQKVADQTLENPHHLRVSRYRTPVLRQSDEREVGADAGVAAPGGEALTFTAAAAWSRRATAPLPYLKYAASCYDTWRGRLVLFGGFESDLYIVGDGAVSGLWEWDGETWHERQVGGPPPRLAATMTFDTRRGVCVLFGGMDPLTQLRLDDTWEWDGRQWALRQSAQRPPPTIHPAMAYAEGLGKVLLFDQRNTWSWDGRSWAAVATAHSPALNPPLEFAPRIASVMGWDRVGRRMLLAAGGTNDTYGLGAMSVSTWSFDGTDWVAVEDGGLPARVGALMAWDESRSQLVVHGGCMSPFAVLGTAMGDTWAWTDAGWSPIAAAGPALEFSGGGFDTRRGALMVYGADGGTFELRGSAWQRIASAAQTPPAAEQIAMAYDARNASTVMCSRTETWLWNGEHWLKAGAAPSPRISPTMTFDRATDTTLLYGGAADGGVIAWSGSAWDAGPGSGAPAVSGNVNTRRWASVLSFPDAGQLGLAQGATYWSWSASSGWVDESVTDGGTAPHVYARPVADPRRSVTVAVSAGTVWERSAGVWTQRASVTPAYIDQVGTFVPSRGEVLFVGGGSDYGFFWFNVAEAFTWDGASWRAVELADATGDGLPRPRRYHAVAYDEARGRAVVFGGAASYLPQGNVYFGDTWELDLEGGAPRAVFELDLLGARVSPAAQLIRLRARAIAGGTSSAGPGAVLSVWSRDKWASPVASTSAGLAPLEVTVTQAAALEEAATLSSRASFEVRTLGARGGGEASLSLDYLEVELRYRLPP